MSTGYVCYSYAIMEALNCIESNRYKIGRSSINIMQYKVYSFNVFLTLYM